MEEHTGSQASPRLPRYVHFCGGCGALLTPPGRYCAVCGADQGGILPPPGTTSVGAAPPASSCAPATSVARAERQASPPLLTVAVEYPLRQSRWRTLIRPVLAAPHLLILLLVSPLVALALVIAWCTIVVTGRYPRRLWRFGSAFLRRQAAVLGYLTLLRDEYPPFAGGPYPISLILEYPAQSSRLAAASRLLLALPAFIAMLAIQYVWSVVVIFAWVSLVANGRQPWGLHRFGAGALQWTLRAYAYALLLTDRYPPFTLGAQRGQPGAPGVVLAPSSPNASASSS